MKVIDFENFLLHPDLAVAEAAISGGPILVSGCRAGTAVILSLDAYNELARRHRRSRFEHREDVSKVRTFSLHLEL